MMPGLLPVLQLRNVLWKLVPHHSCVSCVLLSQTSLLVSSPASSAIATAQLEVVRTAFTAEQLAPEQDPAVAQQGSTGDLVKVSNVALFHL
jgi:hypothetical protein